MRWVPVTFLLALPSILQPGLVAAAPSQDQTAFAARVLELTNAERQKLGLPPLAESEELQTSAQDYSQVLASSSCFDHTCGPVPNFVDRNDQAGYTGWTAIGENIAAGYPTPEQVVAGWLASPEHRANMLSPDFAEMGVGVTRGGGTFGTYWAEEFGRRPSIANQVVMSDPAGDASSD
jgi:uncharacterized protein YkwD